MFCVSGKGMCRSIHEPASSFHLVTAFDYVKIFKIQVRFISGCLSSAWLPPWKRTESGFVGIIFIQC
jgi:hypothetical protein